MWQVITHNRVVKEKKRKQRFRIHYFSQNPVQKLIAILLILGRKTLGQNKAIVYVRVKAYLTGLGLGVKKTARIL